MTETKAAGSLRRTAATEEERREAARAMGSAKTEAKAAASRANGKLKVKPSPGRTPRPLADYACTCGKGDAMEGHPTTCPRGYAIYRRKRAGKL